MNRISHFQRKTIGSFKKFHSPLRTILFRSHYVDSQSSVNALQLNDFHLDLSKDADIYRNLSYEDIAIHETKNGEGELLSNDTFAIRTGKFTGRSPKDKYFVDQNPSNKHIWWGPINQKMDSKVFQELYQMIKKHYQSARKLYVFDGFCGATPESRKKVRFITELAWQHHFVTNMFIRPQSESELNDFEPDFTIINACRVTDPEYTRHKLNSDVFVSFNIEKKVALIGGTWYGGEMKKGIFSMMNYWLPLENVMPMHCSANIGKHGDTALFFGLSGTGKTTLSTDSNRNLIGDDEHGWDAEGIFNFEGGCYAKTNNLSQSTEPQIFDAIKRNALLENVSFDPKSKEPNYTDSSITENGRVSYPIFHIDNFEPSGRGNHPKNIIFLTCDAFGVLPPVSKLDKGQAMYHFLSGYTAKVAGTERDVTEPTATFSTCFGAAFLPLHPTKYADLLRMKLEQHNTQVFLVNTGWTGGPCNVGRRMSIQDTRSCINAILQGTIHKQTFRTDPIFGFQIPENVNNISPKVLNPRDAWASASDYDISAKKLAKMFVNNYKKYISKEHSDYSAHGPRIVEHI